MFRRLLGPPSALTLLPSLPFIYPFTTNDTNQTSPLLRAASISKFLPVVRDPNPNNGQRSGGGNTNEAGGEVIARCVKRRLVDAATSNFDVSFPSA